MLQPVVDRLPAVSRPTSFRQDTSISAARGGEIRELCHRLFESLGLQYADAEWISQRAVITTKNVHLEEIKAIVGAMIPGELRVYKSHDYVEAEDGQRIISEADNSDSETAEHSNDGQANATGEDEEDLDEIQPAAPPQPPADNGQDEDETVEHVPAEADFNPTGAAAELAYPFELLNTLTAGSVLPDHERKLKKNYIMMLLRNRNIAEGHVNGARYQVVRMTNSLLILKPSMGIHAKKILAFSKMPCGPGDEKILIHVFKRV